MRYAFVITALLGASVAGLGQSLTINTTSLPSGSIGQNYSAPLSVTETGGPSSPKLSFSITLGALPPNVNINPDNGTISGTPTSTGLFSFRVTVQDTSPGANVTPGNANLSIQVTGSSLSILNPSLPNGSINTLYSAQLLASDSASLNAQFQWSISSGSLPTGLSLNQSNGIISGTPTAAQSVTFSVTASEGLFVSVSKQFSINITAAPPVAAPVITQTSLPAAGQGILYTFALTATGGVPPYSWSFGGVNNSGLVINSATGVITGTPSANGTFSLTALLTDSIGQTANRTYSLSVSSRLQILTAFLPT
jgi:hypothetical protein